MEKILYSVKKDESLIWRNLIEIISDLEKLPLHGSGKIQWEGVTILAAQRRVSDLEKFDEVRKKKREMSLYISPNITIDLGNHQEFFVRIQKIWQILKRFAWSLYQVSYFWRVLVLKVYYIFLLFQFQTPRFKTTYLPK